MFSHEQFRQADSRIRFFGYEKGHSVRTFHCVQKGRAMGLHVVTCLVQ